MIDPLRRQIAEEAALIVWDEGVADYNQARAKACERLGVSGTRQMPRNTEVEAALLDWLALFATDEDRERLLFLRETALAVMRCLAEFEPRLVGSVLKGTAGRYSVIQLHLFSDDVEAVAIFLLNRRMRYRAITRRQAGGRREGVPGFAFDWDDVPVEALVFPVDGLRAAPPSPIDGKPVRRASIAKVEKLLEG